MEAMNLPSVTRHTGRIGGDHVFCRSLCRSCHGFQASTTQDFLIKSPRTPAQSGQANGASPTVWMGRRSSKKEEA